MIIANLLKKIYKIPAATKNTSADRNMKKLNELLSGSPAPILLNLGSGQRFLGRAHLEKGKKKRIINADCLKLPSVHVLADAHFLPFMNRCFDGIICQAMLEHTQNPFAVVEEMYRTLKSGGIIYAEIPFMQGYHASPGDYYRFSLEGINKLFSEFMPIDSGVCAGPSSTLSWILREYLAGIFSVFSNNRRARQIALFFSGWLTFPIKYLDLLFAKRPGAQYIASGFYFIGKKP